MGNILRRHKEKGREGPETSGVPVGTEYHWYILAHQTAKKLNVNIYETTMTGLKFKLAHKRADKGKWSASGPTQRKHLVTFLKKFIDQMEKEPVPIEFEYQSQAFKGEGVPITQTCEKGFCYELDITLNNDTWGSSATARAARPLNHPPFSLFSAASSVADKAYHPSTQTR